MSISDPIMINILHWIYARIESVAGYVSLLPILWIAYILRDDLEVGYILVLGMLWFAFYLIFVIAYSFAYEFITSKDTRDETYFFVLMATIVIGALFLFGWILGAGGSGCGRYVSDAGGC